MGRIQGAIPAGEGGRHRRAKGLESPSSRKNPFSVDVVNTLLNKKRIKVELKKGTLGSLVSRRERRSDSKARTERNIEF